MNMPKSKQSSHSVRRAIACEILNLSGCDRIYIGYPIWWGEELRILDTFVESCDFSGITMIPFCTSASGGIGSSGQNLAQNAGSGPGWNEGDSPAMCLIRNFKAGLTVYGDTRKNRRTCICDTDTGAADFSPDCFLRFLTLLWQKAEWLHIPYW